MNRIAEEFAAAGDSPTITFGPAHRGRVTGWLVECSVEGHGKMPVLAPGRTPAIVAAGRHRDSEHGGRGRIVERGHAS